MTKNYIAALVLLLATALPGSAINPYRRYDARNGLSDNSVKDICQDSRGYMWFATKDGFNRFNGYRFDVFGSSFSGEHLNIDVICPHSDGIRIWLGCTEALMLFDPRDERLTRFDARNSEGKGIRNCISLLYDPLGDLWIGTDDGLFRWDERIGRLFRYELEESDGGTCRGIRTIFEDNGGEIWVGTTAGLYRYHRKTDRFGRNAKPKPESSLLGDNEITAIVEAEDGKLLIGMQNGYLGEFDIYTGRFTQFPAFDAEGKQLSVARIHTIFRRDMNRYMIGSDSGLFFFSRKNGRWSVSGDNLAEESIYRCFRDREGGIWIGTYFCGVNYLSPRQDEILWYYDDGRPESLDGNAVSQFCDDGRGNLWIATENGGLNHFDVRNRKFTNHTARSHNNLHALCMDGDDLLIGTFSQGLDLMNLRTGKVVNYRNIPGDSASLCNDYVYAIFRASDGTLYVGTMSGMCTFDKRRGRFSRVKITEGRFIYDIAEDTGGNIWVASKVSGIYRYSPGDGTWKNYRHDELDPRSPADDRYIRVYVDTGGQVWFCGESAGICRYDPPTDGFENFGADDNLPNGIYYGVLDDSAGNLWLSSNQGILKYNPQLHTLHDRGRTPEQPVQFPVVAQSRGRNVLLRGNKRLQLLLAVQHLGQQGPAGDRHLVGLHAPGRQFLGRFGAADPPRREPAHFQQNDLLRHQFRVPELRGPGAEPLCVETGRIQQRLGLHRPALRVVHETARGPLRLPGAGLQQRRLLERCDPQPGDQRTAPPLPQPRRQGRLFPAGRAADRRRSPGHPPAAGRKEGKGADPDQDGVLHPGGP